jgi:hypothetical protein
VELSPTPSRQGKQDAAVSLSLQDLQLPGELTERGSWYPSREPAAIGHAFFAFSRYSGVVRFVTELQQ